MQKKDTCTNDGRRLGLQKGRSKILDNKKSILVEKIKNVIIDVVYYSDYKPKTKFSDYLRKKLNLDYTYLANVFSEQTGSTIEHFIIINKIQRIKELIGYNELSLTEISRKLHYSSVAHLSTQFKKITGVTPSHFKHFEIPGHLAIGNV
ncbi:MAG TPA: AraC family transcriptional regulator [Mucilaginibacter sp.]